MEKEKTDLRRQNEETVALNADDLNEFLSATGKDQWKILLAHAERNKKTIKLRRLKEMNDNERYAVEIADKTQTKTTIDFL